MEIILGKVIGIFCIMFIGYGANKIGWLPTESGKYLSKILVNIAQPCLILYTITNQALHVETLSTLGWVLGLAVVVFALSALAGCVFIKVLRVPLRERGVYLFMLTFTNNGFLGLALARTLFDDDGFFLMIMVNLLTIMLLFTVGVIMVSADSSLQTSWRHRLKYSFNIPLIAGLLGIVLLIANLRLPGPASEVLLLLGNMMVPLSMLVVGIQLAGSKAKEVMTEKRYYWLSVTRLVIMPAILFLALFFLPLPPVIAAVLVLSTALPAPAMAVVFAEEYGGNVKIATEGVFITTLFSVAVLPVTMTLLAIYLS